MLVLGLPLLIGQEEAVGGHVQQPRPVHRLEHLLQRLRADVLRHRAVAAALQLLFDQGGLSGGAFQGFPCPPPQVAQRRRRAGVGPDGRAASSSWATSWRRAAPRS